MTGESLTQFATTRLAVAEHFGRALGARVLDHQWASGRALIGAKNSTGEASGSSADSIGSASSPVFGVAMFGVGPMGAPGADTSARADSRVRTWVDGSAIFGDVDGNSDESGFDYTVWGGSLGADVRLAEHWILGLAGGYARTNLDFASRPGDGDVNTYQGALYAGYVVPTFHVGVSGRYAYNDMEGNRSIQFGAIDRKARADLDGHDFGARLEGGLNLLDLGGIVLQPTVSLNYNRLTQDDVTEIGAGDLNLALEDSDLDSLATGVGMRVRGRWEMGSDAWIVPELHGHWLHEFLDTDRLIEARLVSAPAGASAFQIQGVELPRDAGSVGFSWSVITPAAWRITASYDAVLNQDLVQHMGSVTMSLKW
jgi:outer membrane autotransporter protein